MKKSLFKPKTPSREATQCTYLPRPRAPAVAISDGNARLVVQVPKNKPLRSVEYRRWVASLPCAHCHRHAPSQCAHADEGKGMGIKASDADTYPLCADSPGRRGCHSLIGDSGMFTQAQRRALEGIYVARTLAQRIEKQ